jgi:hypothetical protein
LYGVVYYQERRLKKYSFIVETESGDIKVKYPGVK